MIGPGRSATSRLAGTLIGALIGALAVSGCSGSSSSDAPRRTPDAAGGAPVVAPEPPRFGACYQLDVGAALKATSSRPAVPCTGRHTAVTVAVSTVHPVVDGHLLSLASTAVQAQIADRCRRQVDQYVGGTRDRQRLSRVQAVWFNPTPAQVDLGALWYRCDLVVSADSRTFAPLPRRTRHLLAGATALDRWGTCGTTAPSSKHFQRVLCSAAHTWRARSTTTLPAGTSYLARKAAKVADGRCRDVAARLAPHSLKLRWAFEWPTRTQWRSGQRYGFCWTPG